MSDRSVSVMLKANVAGYVASIEKASLVTRDFAKDAQKSAATHKESWDKVGKGMMVTGGVLAAGVTLATKTFMDFDAAMSRAQAGTMATGASLTALRAAAIDAGAKTQFSAIEAADAITAMGKAGVSVKDILGGGLMGALNLAAAGQLDVADAAEIAATAMTQFGLSGKDLPHVADLLAAGAGKAQGSVQDLAGALKYVGPVAKGLDVSIEQTTGVLAEFASQGIIGEQAGTSMRGMLLSLTSPTAIAAKTMADLGLNMYGTNGKFIGMQGAAGQLQAKLGPLSDATRNQALGQLFGNEQITAARILYEGGAPAVQQWTAKVNDAGFASRQAAMLTNNLKGDVERLGGSLSSVLINSGSATNGMLRGMTKELQGVVDLYGSLPVPVQQGATAFAAVGGAATLAVGGLILLAPRIAATKVALAGMGQTGALLSRGLSGTASILKGPVGIALAAGVIGLGYFAKQAQESSARVDELTATLDTQTGAITNNTRAWATKRLSDDGILDLAKRMGVSLQDVTDAALGNADATARVRTALDAYGVAAQKASGVTGLNEAANGAAATNMRELGGAVRITTDETGRATAKAKLLAEANNVGGSAAAGAVGGTKALSSAEQALKTAATDTKKAIDDEVQSLQDAGLAVLSTRSATRELIDATLAATAAHKKNGDGLKVTTAKGRENQAALDAQSSSALRLADSVFKETGSEAKMRASLVQSRASLVATYLQFDNNRGRANAYADSILKIPPAKTTKITADTAKAHANVKAMQEQINNLKGKNIVVTTTLFGQRVAQGPGGQGGQTVAAGGPITGVGGPTQDNIPIWGSVGEFMVNAKSYAKHSDLVNAINADKLAGGGPVLNYSLPKVSAIQSALNAAPPMFPASTGGPGLGGGSGTSGANQALGLAMMLARGWGMDQWPPLKALWTKESGWNAKAVNPSSGAWGIPQSLPAEKMRSSGADYLTNPRTQIDWGLGYIAGRYGSPAGAWAHSQATNWYDTGGMLGPGGIAMNKRGGKPERVLSGQQTESFDRLVALLSSGAARGGGGGSTAPRTCTHIWKIDGREIGRAAVNHIDSELSGGLTMTGVS